MNLSNSKPDRAPFESLLLVIVLILVFFICLRIPSDTDMWWHLSAGRAMINQGRILTTDIFSFTRNGAAWTNAFWFADLALYFAYRMGGFFALTLVATGVMTSILFLIWKRIPGSPLWSMWLILIGGFGLSQFVGARPQLFSFLLLALLDYFLANYKEKTNVKPWILLPLFLLWANVHGGFIWGFLLLFAFVVGEVFNRYTNPDIALPRPKIEKLALWSILAGLITLLNPNGLALWKLPFYTVQVSIMTISEWASPDFHLLETQPMLWLIFLLIIGLALSKKQSSWGDLFKFLGFAYLAFVSTRGIAPFLVIALPYVGSTLWDAWQTTISKTIAISPLKFGNSARPIPGFIAKLINFSLVSLLATFCLIRAFWLSLPAQVDEQVPAAAIQWLVEHHPAGPMFNSYNWGGYLTWIIPQYPVFVDGRADLYGDEILGQWWHVIKADPQAGDILNKWNIRLIVLEPDWPIIKDLPTQGWKVLYRDSQAVIFGR